MTDIPNTKYITINKDGIFVGGKPAIKYRGTEIKFINDVKENFAVTQSRNPEVQELHVGAFETEGSYARPGNPSGKFGPNAWCRVKLFDGRLGSWVFVHTFSSASVCAYNCAHRCSISTSVYSNVCSALLNFAKESDLKQPSKKIELSKFVVKFVGKKLVEFNGVITIQKQK